MVEASQEDKMGKSGKFDLIGDIHGCCRTLEALLDKLGYHQENGVFQHPDRKVIFLGDFVDRGDYQRDVVQVARPMVEGGHALSVMGNHEFNAIAYATLKSDQSDHLRPHTEKNHKQHHKFLDAYADDPEGYEDAIQWFKTLPLWLELDGVRVVHACWDQPWIDRIQSEYGGNLLTSKLLAQGATSGTWEYDAVETLLKGKEIPLPEGFSFQDKDKNERKHIRVRWWDSTANTHRAAFMGPESARSHIPDEPIEGDHLIQYSHDQPPVFLGHYWMEGNPELLAANIACLDYSVAKAGGKLVAYRWNGEQILDGRNFIWTDRMET